MTLAIIIALVLALFGLFTGVFFFCPFLDDEIISTTDEDGAI